MKRYMPHTAAAVAWWRNHCEPEIDRMWDEAMTGNDVIAVLEATEGARVHLACALYLDTRDYNRLQTCLDCMSINGIITILEENHASN